MTWNISRRGLALAASAVVAAVLVSCGGGGSPAGPKVSINRVVVAGDSLADAGTFGGKFTVQKASDPATGYPVYPQIVAANYGVTNLCNFFASSTGGASFTTNPTCEDFAVGGGRVFNLASQGGANAPFSLGFQLGAALQANGGAYTSTDLIIVDAGGNDAADLVQAYLSAAGGNPTNYEAFLGQQLDSATIAATLPQANGAALLAGMYMQKLADTYWATVKSTTLDKGATHVAILNMPDITLTPQFAAVLAQVAGAQGQAAATQLKGAIQQWIQAFNTQLTTDIAGDTRVALVPFYQDFTDEIANPSAYGLTNVTTPTCSDTGFPSTCVDAQLDATPGKTPGWWQTYAFANSFHPTPFGHHLLASSVSRALARAGWL